MAIEAWGTKADETVIVAQSNDRGIVLTIESSYYDSNSTSVATAVLSPDIAESIAHWLIQHTIGKEF